MREEGGPNQRLFASLHEEWRVPGQPVAGLQAGLAEIFGVPQRYIDAITFKQPLRIGKYNEKAACATVNRLVRCKTRKPVCSHNRLHTGQVSAINTMAAGLRYSDRAASSAYSCVFLSLPTRDRPQPALPQALTVSPTYAKEITMDPEKGVELEQLFKMANCTGGMACSVLIAFFSCTSCRHPERHQGGRLSQ